MTPTTRWWWVRHAPVIGPTEIIHGQQDVACETSDRPAFEALAAVLPVDPIWVVSPLRRTRCTLDAILAARGGAPLDPATIIVEPALAEQNFGRWQGLTWSEMAAADPAGYSIFWQDPTRTAPPGGESFLSLMRRSRRAIEALTSRFQGRDIVAVSHGGTIRAAVALALKLGPEAAMAVVVDNLSLTRIENVSDGLLRGHGGVWLVRGINLPSRWILSKSAC